MTDVASQPLPAFARIHAGPTWRNIDFISDLHLAEDTPRTFDAFAAHLHHTDADAVFILGDLFEAWVGDDARHQGFEARCALVLTEAASRRVIGFMAGNRDFLVGGEMLASCHVMALADPTVLEAFGARVLLTHGDALCLSDVPYQRFRAQVRSESWQRDFLALPLAKRREAARVIRAESERLKVEQADSDFFDVDPAEAVRWMTCAGTPVMIHGHTHAPGSNALAPGFLRHVLSDWDLDHTGSRPRAQVLRWQRDGFERRAPASAD